MPLWEMEITQTDCPHVLTSEKFENLRIVIMGTEITGKYEKIFSVFSSPDEHALNEALVYFQKNKLVKNFNLLSIDSGVATAIYAIPQTSMFKKLSSVGLRIHPIVVKKGIERWHVIVTEQTGSFVRSSVSDQFTQVRAMKKKKPDELFKSFYQTVRYMMPALSMSDKISERDLDLVKSARELGYFGWPRKSNLTALSSKLDMPKSTLSYRLRSIEEKIAEALV